MQNISREMNLIAKVLSSPSHHTKEICALQRAYGGAGIGSAVASGVWTDSEAKAIAAGWDLESQRYNAWTVTTLFGASIKMHPELFELGKRCWRELLNHLNAR